MVRRSSAAVIPLEGADALSGRARQDAIYQEIRRRICTLAYAPGEALKETELAAEFNVSRTPMRQVLQRLEFEALVESKRGVGTIVTRVEFEALREVYELRMKLAEMIGVLTPVTPTAEDVAAMEQLEARCRALRESKDPKEFAALNLDFHERLMRLVGNAPLRETLSLLFHRTARIWLSWEGGFDWDEEIDRFEREIGELLIGLRLGDMRSVGFAHRNHISMSLIRIRRYVERSRRKE